VEPNDYIRSFFENIKAQLRETKMGLDGKSARYREFTVAAAWSNNLWDVHLDDESPEPVRRLYDPTKARSTESAANYFVDALRKATGQEPIVRAETMARRFGAGRARNNGAT